MPVQIWCKVCQGCLVPLTAQDHEQLRLFPLNADIKGTFVRKKSRPMLRLYWATVQEVADGLGLGKEQLSHRLLYACGQVDGFHAKDGAMVVVPKSIAAMHAGQFKDYVNQAIAVLFGDYAAPESKSNVIQIAERKARTTFREAMRDLDSEIDKEAA